MNVWDLGLCCDMNKRTARLPTSLVQSVLKSMEIIYCQQIISALGPVFKSGLCYAARQAPIILLDSGLRGVF